MHAWTEEITGAAIVVVGAHNPSIFQPLWLAKHNLISEPDAERAEVHVLHPEIASLGLGGDLQLEVTRDRLVATATSPASFLPLRDLVEGLFLLLEHAPVTRLALARQAHYRAPSLAARQQLGDALAPKSAWAPILEQPGLRSVLLEGTVADDERIRRFVKVEPSVRVKSGAFFEVTEESNLGEDGSSPILRGVLRDRWSVVMKFAEQTVATLLELAPGSP